MDRTGLPSVFFCVLVFCVHAVVGLCAFCLGSVYSVCYIALYTLCTLSLYSLSVLDCALYSVCWGCSTVLQTELSSRNSLVHSSSSCSLIYQNCLSFNLQAGHVASPSLLFAAQQRPRQRHLLSISPGPLWPCMSLHPAVWSLLTLPIQSSAFQTNSPVQTTTPDACRPPPFLTVSSLSFTTTSFSTPVSGLRLLCYRFRPI